LDKSDFALYDNGVLQTITDFESRVLTVAAAGRAEAGPAPAPSPKAAAPLLNRKFFFIIDYLRNDLEGVQKAKNAVLEFLDTKVQPGDEVSLYTLSPIGGLTLLDYLTTDRDKLRRTLAKLRDTPGITPVAVESELYGHEPIGMELLAADVFGRHGGHGGTGSRNHFAEIASWAKSLRAIQGQKNVILFSRGFGGSVIRPGDSANALFQLMAKELATANAPVFTINTTTGVDAKVAQGVFPESSLDYLSRTTGGKYFPDVNYYARIATDIQDSTANYYVLGYSISAAWDGKYHDVKVEVLKKGYEVRAQRGYFNPVPFGKLSPVEKHLHLLEVALGENASAKQTQAFPLTALQFPGDAGANTLLLSEFPGDLREALGERVEFVSLVMDENRALVDGKRWDVDWKDLQAARVFQYSVASLTPGRYDCRAVLRNLDDGRSAVGACTIDVVPTPAEGPAMSAPLLLVRGPEPRYLSVTPAEKGKGQEGFSISRIFLFPAKEYVPLIGPLEPGVTSFSADLVGLWRDERGNEKDLSARLRLEGSEEDIPITTELLSASSRDDKDFYLLSFEFPELSPGRYRLEIQAEDQKTGSVVSTASRFTVRPPA
jgi:VWFA-related protein